MKTHTIRKAASILLCRNNPLKSERYDYQVLISVLAFPGGKEEPNKDPETVKQSGWEVDPFTIAKATALRECFEETGLYCADQPVVDHAQIQEVKEICQMYEKNGEYEQNNISKMRKNYNSNGSKCEDAAFVAFKQMMKISPLAKINPFIRLITVPSLPSRYDAWFYVHKIEESKVVNFLGLAVGEQHLHDHQNIMVNDECKSFRWWNPLEVLIGFSQKNIKLAPPQFIMLNIMAKFPKFSDFQAFISTCNNEINMGPNIVSMVPNKYSTKDKYPYAATLLGDSEFPFSFIQKTEKKQEILAELSNFHKNSEFSPEREKEFAKVNENSLASNKIFSEGNNISLGNPSNLFESSEKIFQSSKPLENPFEPLLPLKLRLLFQKPLQFFEEDYSHECNVPGSVFQYFMDSKELKMLIQKGN